MGDKGNSPASPGQAQPPPINVLYVIDHMGLGGAQRLVVDILARMDVSKYNVMLCCLREPGPLGREAEARGLRVIYLGRRKYDPRRFSDLVRTIRSNKIELVHTHLLASSMLGRTAGAVCRVPVVLQDHTGRRRFSGAPAPVRGIVSSMDRVLMRFTDRVIAVSQSVKDYWVVERKVDSHKVVVIYNGIDLSSFRPDLVDSAAVRRELGLDSAALVVGTVARLNAVKGLQYLLEAAVTVGQRIPEARFIIVGDGPLRRELEDQSKKLRIDDKMIFTGFRSDIPRLLGAMDVFVLPSLWETLGIASLEAMSMGKPVVATTVGGIPEVVLPGVTGLLVPPADFGALSQAIIELLDDPAKRKTFGENGRTRAKEFFSIEATVRKMEALYEELWAARC